MLKQTSNLSKGGEDYLLHICLITLCSIDIQLHAVVRGQAGVKFRNVWKISVMDKN